jgi:radical SAM protein with 4Fe4S-binding SPASM domain
MDANYRRLKLAITDSCNLNCAHCYLADKTSKHLPLDRVACLIREAAELGVQVLDLTGAEPTTHPDFARIVELAREQEVLREINLSTNGLSLLKPQILRTVRSHNVKCNISIDGSKEQVVDAVRGKNVFRRLERVFAQLRSDGIQFTFRFSINSVNYRDIDNILRYASRWDVPVDIEPTQHIGNAIAKDFVLSSEQFDYVARRIELMTPSLPVCVTDSFRARIPCDGGFADLLSVNSDGAAVTCLMVDRLLGATNTPLGSLPLRHQWDSLQRRKRKMKDFLPILDQCATCNYRQLCSSGCLVTAYQKGCIK